MPHLCNSPEARLSIFVTSKRQLASNFGGVLTTAGSGGRMRLQRLGKVGMSIRCAVRQERQRSRSAPISGHQYP